MGLGSTLRLFPLWPFALTQLSITVVQCPLCLVFCGLPELAGASVFVEKLLDHGDSIVRCDQVFIQY